MGAQPPAELTVEQLHEVRAKLDDAYAQGRVPDLALYQGRVRLAHGYLLVGRPSFALNLLATLPTSYLERQFADEAVADPQLLDSGYFVASWLLQQNLVDTSEALPPLLIVREVAKA